MNMNVTVTVHCMLNVIIGMICLGSPHCFYHRISQNSTDFVVESREAERKCRNGIFYNVCCHTGGAIISTRWTHQTATAIFQRVK